MAAINLFPTLTKETFKNINLEIYEIKFKYHYHGETRKLQKDFLEDNTFQLIDNYGMWNPSDNNLEISGKIHLQNINELFGESGVACHNAKIGIGIRWTSSQSRQRGIIKVVSLSKGDLGGDFAYSYVFEAGRLRGDIKFDLIFYIEKAGSPSVNEMHLANIPGTVIGTYNEYSFVLSLDGMGSMFPIYEKEMPNKPLWNVVCDWDNPASDAFSEYVYINFNTAHKNYCYINSLDTEHYNPQVVVEIMTQAIFSIMSTLKENEEEWNEMLEGNGLSKGSVSYVINYMINSLGLSVETSADLLYSLREKLEGKFLS